MIQKVRHERHKGNNRKENHHGNINIIDENKTKDWNLIAELT